MFFRRSAPAVTIHERIEQQAAVRPRAIALSCDGVELTYREWNDDANRLAERLSKARIAEDGLLPIAMQRSCDLAVAMLAVLKSGRPFVLANAADNPHSVLAACGAKHVITDSPRVFERAGVQTINPFVTSGVSRNPGRKVGSERWACGIAGKIHTHDSALKMLEGIRAEQDFRDGDGLFSAADLGGMGSLELFLPLIAGGRLVLATDEEMRDPVRLESAMRAAGCRFSRLPKAPALGAGLAANAAFA